MAKLAKRPAKAHRKYTWGNFFIGLFILAFSLVCLLPMVLTVIVSFTDERAIMRNGYSFFPEQFSTYAYELMFNRGSSVIQGYLVSIFVTVVGTLSAVLITGLAAYTLANKNVKYRNVLGMYFFIPMVFGAGIVPWYLMCTALNLRNNIFALLIPNLLFNTFNLFLVQLYERPARRAAGVRHHRRGQRRGDRLPHLLPPVGAGPGHGGPVLWLGLLERLVERHHAGG